MQLKLSILTTMLFCLVCAICTQVSANEKLIVLTENWLPYNYENNDGKVVGSSTQVVKDVLTNAGYEFEISVYPWARAYEMAKNNENVVLYSISQTIKRQPDFQWICPISESPPRSYFYAHIANSDMLLSEVADAKKHITGVIYQDFGHSILQSSGFRDGIELDVSHSDSGPLKKLLKKRVDLIISTEANLAERAKLLGVESNQFVKKISVNTNKNATLCMVVGHSTNANITRKIQAALDKYLRRN